MTATVQPQAGAYAPARIAGKQRSALGVIGLSIITLGIYSLFWLYKTFQEMKDWNGEGVGGVIGLLLGFIPLVTLFLMPSEVKNLYERDGAAAPVSPMTGLWVLLPFVGGLVWLFKVQGALNTFWASH